MERLTKAHYNGNGYYMACSEECHSPADCIDCAALDKLVDRLAAYEDTGLTPEGIETLNIQQDAIGRITAGLTVQRIAEICNAEYEGRLVVLPCAVDATAYYADADAGRVLAGYVADYEFLRGGDCYFNFYNVESDIEWVSVELPIEEFGKTVFLTCEEAQTALKTQSPVEFSEKTQPKGDGGNA